MNNKIIVSILIVITLAAFYPALNGEFINFDDNEYVTENTIVKKGLTREGFLWAFTTFHVANWHPLTWLSHMLDVQLFGLNAGFHHLVNIIFHIAGTILLCCIFNLMTGSKWPSAFVAAIFAVHPLHVESVAWVSERKDVLSTLFWMLTIAAYLWYLKKPGIKRYLTIMLFLSLGLMAKPMLVTLPFVLILLDYWPLGRFAAGRKLLLEKIPLIILSVISSVVTYVVQSAGGAVRTWESVPFTIRATNALVSYVNYLYKALWPHSLSVFYPYPRSNPEWWTLLGALSIMIAISFFAIRMKKKYPYVIVGWFWYLGTLVPVIGFIQIGSQAMADRYTYVPLVGVSILAAYGLRDLMKRWPYFNRLIIVMVFITLGILVFATNRQVGYWQNSYTLFSHALVVDPDNYMAHNNLGAALISRGEVEEAVDHYLETIRINPSYAKAYYNLGKAREAQGRPGEALSAYQKAIFFREGFFEAYNNLGNALFNQGRTDMAIKYYEKARELNKENPQPSHNLGVAFSRLGKSDDAIAYFTEALGINPQFVESHVALGVVLSKQGKTQKAIAHFSEAVRIQPEHSKAYFYLGNALYDSGKFREAINSYQEAINLNPDNEETYLNLGASLLNLGMIKDSTRYFFKALDINPEFAPAHFNLGWAYEKLGQADQSIKHYRKASQLDPGFSKADKRM